MKNNKIKRYFRNVIFMILMTIAGFILLPFLSLLFLITLLYVPFEIMIYYKSQYKIIWNYSYLYTLFYRKTIEILKYFNKNDIKYIYDTDNKFFMFSVDNTNYILFINSKNRKERTKIITIPMDKYLCDKYNIVNYKYITNLKER